YKRVLLPEFWVINTRCAPLCNDLDRGFEKLTFQRWCADTKCFIDETRDSYLVAQSQLPTLMYVHGNSLDHEKALVSAWKIYERVKVCPGRKLMVLWSWPAEPVYKRPLLTPVKLVRKNIQTKYRYAERQGYYLAKMTQLMSKQHPLTLGGHSFGAVTALCATHYLGGGQLNGYTLAGGSTEQQYNLRISLISPALDNDHLYPGHRYEMALYPVEKLHTTFSTEDATLKRWPNYSFRGCEAMGYTGIRASRLGVNAHKLCQQRLTEDVGRSHYLKEHLASVQMISQLCNTAFNTLPTAAGSSSSSRSFGVPSVNVQEVIQAPVKVLAPFGS
ncbi:MAG: hypothetical protein AAF483_28715, partial [Planctomycetota bacterium]